MTKSEIIKQIDELTVEIEKKNKALSQLRFSQPIGHLNKPKFLLSFAYADQLYSSVDEIINKGVVISFDIGYPVYYFSPLKYVIEWDFSYYSVLEEDVQFVED